MITQMDMCLHWECIDTADRNMSRRMNEIQLQVQLQLISIPVFNLVWVWNLVAESKGGKEAEGDWEYGVEENIWT